jgi:hypothetical protein
LNFFILDVPVPPIPPVPPVGFSTVPHVGFSTVSPVGFSTVPPVGFSTVPAAEGALTSTDSESSDPTLIFRGIMICYSKAKRVLILKKLILLFV